MADSKVIKEFVAKFSVDGSKLLHGFKELARKTSNFAKGLGKAFSPRNFKRLAGGIIAVFVAMFAALAKMVQSFQKSVLEIADSVGKTGASSEFVSRLGSAVEVYGGSVGDAVAATETLQQALTDLSFGQGALIDAARKWGLVLHKPNGEMMSMEEQLRAIEQRMQSMSAAEASDLGGMLGLDGAMIRLLRSGRMSELMNKSRWVVSAEDVKLAQEM